MLKRMRYLQKSELATNAKHWAMTLDMHKYACQDKLKVGWKIGDIVSIAPSHPPSSL